MTIPLNLNGYPVIHSETYPNGISTVLIEKKQEWVVATWAPILKSEWAWGHYFPFTAETKIKRLMEARADFAEVSIRNFQRGRL